MTHRRAVLVKVWEQRFTRTGGKGHKVRKQDGSSEGLDQNVHQNCMERGTYRTGERF